MKNDGTNAFPLAWPTGWKRTSFPKRSKFKTTFTTARGGLLRQIKLLGGAHVVLSSDIPLRNDGLPRAGQAQPRDKGVAVYFYRGNKQLVFACDKWDRIEDNIRAIEKTIENLRGIERWGASEMMERAFTSFESLPPPRPRADTAARPYWDVPGIRRGSPRNVVHDAYRSKARTAHPDAGGSHARMSELNRAREEADKEAAA